MTSTAPALTTATNRTGSPGQRGADSALPPAAGRLGLSGRPAVLDIAVCFGFVLLAAWLTHGLWPNPELRTLALNPADQILYEWFLAHDTTLWTGGFSLVSDRLNAPNGVNLLANTTVIALGAVFAPVTLAFGAATTFALIVALNLAGTASAWYLLFRRTMGAARGAAAVGAVCCGFAPGMMSQSNSHLHMTAQWLIPAMLWCVATLARAARDGLPVLSPRTLRAGVLFGVLVALQVFIGEETLFLTALTLMLVTVVYLALTRPAPAAVGRFFAGLGVGAAVAVALLAYPLWTQFKGPMSVSDGVFSPHYFSADLASFVAISPLSLAGDESASRLTTGAAEYNTFLGWPLVLLVLGLAVWLRREVIAVCCAVAALVMCALALGPEVVLNGHRSTVDGPFTLLESLPVVDGALPMRFALAAIPLLATLIVLALQRARGSRPWVRVAVSALVAAALLPIAPIPLPAMDRLPVPQFYAEGHWRGCVDEGGVLVPVPLPTPPQPEPMRYATAAQTAFALPEGFFIAPYGGEGRATMGTGQRPTSALLAEVAKTGVVPPLTDDRRRDARDDLRRWAAQCVVLTAHPRFAQLRQSLEGLLGPGTVVSDAVVWRRTW